MAAVSFRSFGPITVIPGNDGSRFPFCTTLFIDDHVKAVIDPGAGMQPLRPLCEKASIELVLNTHYHFDHIAFNYLFDTARILINEREAECFRNRRRIGALLGMTEVYGGQWVDAWLERIACPDAAQSPYSPQNNHKWWLSTMRLGGTYRGGDVMDFGTVAMHVIDAPGHSAGFCCFAFPDYGVVYAGDLDLTDFGPWYGGTDGDIDLFIASARRIGALDADWFITGHEKGIVSAEEFREKLDTFLRKIDERDHKILTCLDRPKGVDEIARCGVIYHTRFHVDAWIYMWNLIMVKKHLRRLLQQGRIIEADDKYVAA